MLRNRPGKPLPVKKDHYFDGEMFAEYVEWREKNPSDDLITELLQRRVRRRVRNRPRLTKDEILTFLAVIAGAGVETTGRLFGWMGKVLAEHPDQRRELVEDRSLIPQCDRGTSALRAPGPARRPLRHPRTSSTTARGAGRQRAAAHARVGQSRRAPFEDPDRFDIHRNPGQHVTFGYGAPLLPRCRAGPPRGTRSPSRRC